VPLFSLSSEQAKQIRKHNPNAGWGDRGSSNRVEPIALPDFNTPFRVQSGEAIFTIGSCFARNVENELVRRGFKVPVRDLFRREEFHGLDVGIINNYGTPSIYNEIAWAFGEQEFDPEDHIVELTKGKFVDLHLSPTMRPESREIVLLRREAAFSATRTAKNCRVVIMTLGLTEVWFDTKTGFYLNVMPRPSLMSKEPDRFQLHVLNYDETFLYLDKAIQALMRNGHPELQVLLTVSPVPLTVTHRPVDVLVANMYSKSALRVAAETAVATYPFVTYYPSYESVTLSDRRRAFDDDLRHVTTELISINVSRMIDAYCGDVYERDGIASAINAGGAEAAVAQATLAAGSTYAAEFFTDHSQWADRSVEFALLYARHLVDGREYGEAVTLLRQHVTQRLDHLELLALLAEALLKDGRNAEATTLLREMNTRGAKAKSFWDAIVRVAIALDDVDLVLTALARYAEADQTHVPGAYLKAARFFRDRKDEARAMLFYREAWERRGWNAAGFELAELLTFNARQEEARKVLGAITPATERERKTLERLTLAAA
jgi:hypothetical protein